MAEMSTLQADQAAAEGNLSDLYARLCSFENLLAAYREAARGKRRRPDVAAFDYDMEGRLLRLRNQLRAQTWRPHPYRRFTVAEPKPRVISAAPFEDRVVHHALCNVIEPLFERRIIADSYANRRGKGIHQALDRATHFARRYRYVLRCDIVEFFPSIDLAILRHELGRVVRDDQTLALCDAILAGGAGELVDQYTLVLYPGDDPAYPEEAQARPRGLPIGNQTSQFWANCYLNPLDHFVKDQLGCRAYLRYVDDFLLFADDKPTLHRWKAAIVAFLARRLRLAPHARASVVTPVAVGIPFLGFRVYPDHRRLRRRNGIAFARRLRQMARQYRRGALALPTVSARVRGWVAHAAHADTCRLRRSLLESVVFSPPADVSAEGSHEGIARLRQDV
jgi:Reverse transcriptase (RNA-dependent DNA polymerase)